MLRFIVWLLLLGAVLYVVFWALDRRAQGEDHETPRRPAPHGPIGPDDDEEFLRNLDRRPRDDP